MKIKKEDFEKVKKEIKVFVDKNRKVIESYRKQVSPERFRWDVFLAANVYNKVTLRYLQDSHIDTALKRIIENI